MPRYAICAEKHRVVAYPRELPGRKALTYQLILRIPAISIFFSAKGWSWYPYLGQPPSIEINAFRVLTLVVLHGPACRRPCKAGQGGCAGAMPCTLDRTRTVEKDGRRSVIGVGEYVAYHVPESSPCSGSAPSGRPSFCSGAIPSCLSRRRLARR